jgi:hypothetical protein
MANIIGACGLKCHECPGYTATQANDAEAVAKVAKEWSEAFHTDVKPEHVWCDGCMTAAPRKCAHTAECEIRSCVIGKGLSNCAACLDYACPTLQGFFAMVPAAKDTLDALRTEH